MRVSVFGLGYVGCVTSACLAKAGHEVVGVDVNREKVEMIAAGRSPIVEPGLGEVLAEVVFSGRLRATDDTVEAVRATDLALICVGTPGRGNGQLDTSAVERVAESIGRALAPNVARLADDSPRPVVALPGRDRYTVVLRSTVLPGTVEGRVAPALARGAGRPLDGWLGLAVNPEFMREGSSLADFARPPMTLVGTAEPETAERLRELYASVEAPFVATSIRSAEMAKYVSNAYHALKVCFANEIGDLCAALGADAQEVTRVFLMDTKLNVSPAYLKPGFAFGGSCLPKDVRALVHAAHGADLSSPLLSSIIPANEAQVRRGVEAVLETRRRRVGVVGLAFKTGTDDLRESPMVTLVETLIGKGCEVRILDESVAVAKLVGANRRFIEEEIPHVSALMCADTAALIDHAEVLVVGAAGDAATRVLRAARPDQIVIDLTRGAAAAKAAASPAP